MLLVQWRLIFCKDLCLATRAIFGRTGARVGADFVLNDARRARKFAPGQIGVSRLHKIMPDRTGAGRPRQVDHGGIVRVAHPDARHQVGGIADGPRIAKVIGRPGLGGGWPGEFENTGTVKGPAARLRVGEDTGDEVGVLGRNDLLASRRSVIHQDVAPAVLDAQDRAGWHTRTAVGKDGKGPRHLQQRDLAAPQRERQPVGRGLLVRILGAKDLGVRQRSGTQPRGHLQQSVDPHELERSDSRDVVRVGERLAHQHRAVIFLVIVDRDVRWVGPIRELGAQIPHQRGRRPAALKGSGVRQGLDRGARLAAA